MTWFSINQLKEWESETGKEKEGVREGEQKKTLHRKQKLPFTCCILYMSVTFYTDTDIKTLVKCWYDATMTDRKSVV